MGDIWNIKEQYKRQMGNLWSRGSRGLYGGGYSPGSPSRVNTIEYISISSTGDGADFGDLTNAMGYCCGGKGSATRSLFNGGYTGAAYLNVIDYVTPSSLGNAADFGDATTAKTGRGGFSNDTRCVFGGGSTAVNIIDYVTIASR